MQYLLTKVVRKYKLFNHNLSNKHAIANFCSLQVMIMLFGMCIFLLNSSVVDAQVTIRVNNASDFPDSIVQHLYVAGDFNGWQPADEAYHLTLQDGKWSLTFKPPGKTKTLQFKFTNGSWEKEEVHADGSRVDNRVYDYTPGMVLDLDIEAFRKMLPAIAKELNKNVIVLKIPSTKLGYEKTIRVYLPCDYATSTQQYPVLYMLDGQNLFDDQLSYAGEWGIDESMDSICHLGETTAIIVGIDHAGDARLAEYTPWKVARFNESGKGDLFAQFVVEELKPHIDSLYRTLPDRIHTGIGGSSVGGVMSQYLVLQYNDVFGNALVFSPSFWISKQNFQLAEAYTSDKPTAIYYLAGGREGDDDDMQENAIAMYRLLQKKQINNLTLRIVIEGNGIHTESFWRKGFSAAYLWLFEK
ncbi:MAG TPA: alpha/beta hydrolase-fold protein [Chitinophagales bacterium]|nr:alpha/beta hydrolase-fold protein [Chitinophagales bacterium]